MGTCQCESPFQNSASAYLPAKHCQASHIIEAGIKVWGRMLHLWGEGHAMSYGKGSEYKEGDNLGINIIHPNEEGKGNIKYNKPPTIIREHVRVTE